MVENRRSRVAWRAGRIIPQGSSEPRHSNGGSVLVLIFAMLGIDSGLEAIGMLDLIVGRAAPSLGPFSPYAPILVLFALTSVLTETVTNDTATVIFTPVAIAIAPAQATDSDPRALIVAAMFAASASFATPIGYQTNTMVYAAADYRFSDFLRVCVPMNLIVGLATCAATAWLIV